MIDRHVIADSNVLKGQIESSHLIYSVQSSILTGPPLCSWKAPPSYSHSQSFQPVKAIA